MAHDRRKADHIRINLEENVQFPTLTNGFERYRLVHQALPELDLQAVDTCVDAARQDAALAVPDLVDDGRDRSGAGDQPQPGRGRAGPRHRDGARLAAHRHRAARDCRHLPGPRRGARHPAVRQPRRDSAQLSLRRGPVPAGRRDDRGRRADPAPEPAARGRSGRRRLELVAACSARSRRSCARSGVPVVAKEVGWGISEATAAAAQRGRGRRDRRGGLRRHLVERGRVPPGHLGRRSASWRGPSPTGASRPPSRC